MSTIESAPEATAAKPRSRLGIVIGVGLVVLIVTAGIAFLAGRLLQPYNMHATVLEPPLPTTDFTFISSRTGELVSLSDFRGKVVLLYFGFTTCPDVCPATLSDYRDAYEILGKKTEDVQFLWVTVDPERDTPEKMEDYISHFDTEFMGLIPPTPEDLAKVAAAYSIYYQRHDVGSATGYLMDHTASVALIDADGLRRAIINFDAPAEEIAADVEYMISTTVKK